MKKQNVKWKREYSTPNELMFNYYHLLLVGFNKLTLSDKEITTLVELNQKPYNSKELGALADNVGFKHQVLKNALTKLKKLKLIYCVANNYTINPSIAVSTDIKALELTLTANVTV
jgi:hypothetical protein